MHKRLGDQNDMCKCGKHFGDYGGSVKCHPKELYRLRTGTSPLIKIGMCNNCGRYLCEYVKSDTWTFRFNSELVPYVGDGMTCQQRAQDMRRAADKVFNWQNRKESAMSRKLYVWIEDGKEVYGHRLTSNSAGLWVMEAKGGEVKAVDKSTVTEVMPFTIAANYLGGSRQYHFFAKEGDYEVGDVVFAVEYQTPLVVAKLDTKARAAAKWLNGAVIRPTKVVDNSDEDAVTGDE